MFGKPEVGSQVSKLQSLLLQTTTPFKPFSTIHWPESLQLTRTFPIEDLLLKEVILMK